MVQLKQLCFKILAFSVVVDPNQVIKFFKKKISAILLAVCIPAINLEVKYRRL